MIQYRTRLKDLLFEFLSALWLLSKSFYSHEKDPSFFKNFATNWTFKKPKGPPWIILKTLRFLSLKYSADFRRSRLVWIKKSNVRIKFFIGLSPFWKIAYSAYRLLGENNNVRIFNSKISPHGLTSTSAARVWPSTSSQATAVKAGKTFFEDSLHLNKEVLFLGQRIVKNVRENLFFLRRVVCTKPKT